MNATITPLAGERLPGESDAATSACNDYLLMGQGRSLRKLIRAYIRQSSDSSQTVMPPTLSWGTLTTWSIRHEWQQRARAYDVQREADKAEERTAEADEGLRSANGRLAELEEMHALLIDQLYQTDDAGELVHLWLRDVKAINGETVEIRRFNESLIRQLRGLLDDIAREVGQRAPNQPNIGPGGNESDDLAKLVNEELAKLFPAGPPYPAGTTTPAEEEL